jgi:phosphohistidine phosphatase SixA
MLLLRHASAGERLANPTRDAARGLDGLGLIQAASLHDDLAGYGIERIVSSPLPRCVETVAPLASALGLEVEIRSELEPTASRRRALRLLHELPESSLVCTHREVFESLFGTHVRCEKGATWLVARRRRSLVPTAYLRPAERADVRRLPVSVASY